MSSSCVSSCSPTLAFFTPIEGFVFDFLVHRGPSRWWSRTSGLLFVSTFASISTVGGMVFTGGVRVLRTLVRPMTGLVALVTIALLTPLFRCTLCLRYNKVHDFSLCYGSLNGCSDISECSSWSSDIWSMTCRRPRLTVILRTINLFGLATHILISQCFSDHVCLSTWLLLVSNVKERLVRLLLG